MNKELEKVLDIVDFLLNYKSLDEDTIESISEIKTIVNEISENNRR